MKSRGWAPGDEISAPERRDTREFILQPCTSRKSHGIYSKNCQTMKWVSSEPDHTITLILDFQFFQDCEKIRVYCLSQVYGILLRQPRLTKTEGQIYSHSLDSCNQMLITGDLETHPVRQYIRIEACCSEMLPLLGL